MGGGVKNPPDPERDSTSALKSASCMTAVKLRGSVAKRRTERVHAQNVNSVRYSSSLWPGQCAVELSEQPCPPVIKKSRSLQRGGGDRMTGARARKRHSVHLVISPLV